MELQDEATWLRNRIVRMRLAFRFATEPQVESILRELIADAEDRHGVKGAAIRAPGKRLRDIACGVNARGSEG
jgi:hypothetical protein